jgi:hypothetical protein
LTFPSVVCRRRRLPSARKSSTRCGSGVFFADGCCDERGLCVWRCGLCSGNSCALTASNTVPRASSRCVGSVFLAFLEIARRTRVACAFCHPDYTVDRRLTLHPYLHGTRRARLSTRSSVMSPQPRMWCVLAAIATRFASSTRCCCCFCCCAAAVGTAWWCWCMFARVPNSLLSLYASCARVAFLTPLTMDFRLVDAPLACAGRGGTVQELCMEA